MSLFRPKTIEKMMLMLLGLFIMCIVCIIIGFLLSSSMKNNTLSKDISSKTVMMLEMMRKGLKICLQWVKHPVGRVVFSYLVMTHIHYFGMSFYYKFCMKGFLESWKGQEPLCYLLHTIAFEAQKNVFVQALTVGVANLGVNVVDFIVPPAGEVVRR